MPYISLNNTVVTIAGRTVQDWGAGGDVLMVEEIDAVEHEQGGTGYTDFATTGQTGAVLVIKLAGTSMGRASATPQNISRGPAGTENLGDGQFFANMLREERAGVGPIEVEEGGITGHRQEDGSITATVNQRDLGVVSHFAQGRIKRGPLMATQGNTTPPVLTFTFFFPDYRQDPI